MSSIAKQYLDAVAESIGEKFKDVRVDEKPDEKSAALAVAVPSPFEEGAELALIISMAPAKDDMFMMQIMADLTRLFPFPVPDDMYEKVSKLNDTFTYGAVLFGGTQEEKRFCLYNYGFLADGEIIVSDISKLLGDSVDKAIEEICSDETTALFGVKA